MSKRPTIAADTAHAWARSLALDNPHAKSVLRALALYADQNGCCYAGLDRLADDTDLTIDTVRRRLVWLEGIGAIQRRPQWIDASGRRNGDGRGKCTSDEVQLLMDAEPEEISRRAKRANGDKASGPRRRTGLQPPVSPTLALAVEQGTESSERELEQEGSESARAREPLVSEAATKLAGECLLALGLEPEHPPDGWYGLAYDCEVLVKRGCDPPLVVATFAQFRGKNKPKAYVLKAVDTAHRKPTGPYEKTQRSYDGSGEKPAAGWQSSRDAFRRARAELKASVAAARGGEGGSG